MSTGLAYGLTGLLGLALGLTNARKQQQQDALLESQLRGPGTWEPVTAPDDRSWLAKVFSAGLPQSDIEVSPGHRYRFTPYPRTTEADLVSWGLTRPVKRQETFTVPAWPEPGGYVPGSGFAPTGTAPGAPLTGTREVVRDEPIRGFLDIPKSPEFQHKIAEIALAQRERAVRRIALDQQLNQRRTQQMRANVAITLMQKGFPPAEAWQHAHRMIPITPHETIHDATGTMPATGTTPIGTEMPVATEIPAATEMPAATGGTRSTADTGTAPTLVPPVRPTGPPPPSQPPATARHPLDTPLARKYAEQFRVAGEPKAQEQVRIIARARQQTPTLVEAALEGYRQAFGKPHPGLPPETQEPASTGGAVPPAPQPARPPGTPPDDLLTAKQQELERINKDLAEAKQQWDGARAQGHTGGIPQTVHR